MGLIRNMLGFTKERTAMDGTTSTNSQAPWMQTYSGVAFELLAPTPDMVRFADIAHALARLCRYNGHVTPMSYSVAEHCMLVSAVLPQSLKLQGLMHDAAEAYIGDISSPLKVAIGPEHIEKVEAPIRQAIATKFGLPFKHHPLVKKADLWALNYERKALLGREPKSWALPILPEFAEFDRLAIPLRYMNPFDAEANLIDTFYGLKPNG